MISDDYYLHNFLELVRFVGRTYGELLNESEHAWMHKVQSVSEPARRLYIRLLGRRRGVFRVSKLRYDEIPDINVAVAELAACELVCTNAPGTVAELLQLFTKPELLKLPGMQIHKQLARADLVAAILARDSSQDQQELQSRDSWVEAGGLHEYAVFCLCFFGNCYQDVSEFVLRDLGLVEYEAYTIDSNSRAFQTRRQIDAQLACFDCTVKGELLDMSDAQAILAFNNTLPRPDKSDPHLQRRVDRYRNRLARQLERLKQNDDALQLYSQTSRPPSRERQVRLLIQQARFDEAAQLWRAIQDTPVNEEELYFCKTVRAKLAKHVNLPASRLQSHKPLVTRINLTRGAGRVEMIAREFYSQYGECFYVENALVNGVLGLFIWDIMFLPVTGAFYNPFQSMPADFYQPEFMTLRNEQLVERFTELDDPLLFAARVWEVFDAKQGISNRLVNWSVLSPELLSLALIRIPVEHWRALFNRILEDLRNHTSGLPDLVLFPKGGGYELLEIKGPGDALQKNQRRWMAYFAEQNISYRVVNVRWSSDSPGS